jgi:hypothetical protein
VIDAFDADSLIYAAVPGHPLGSRVAALFSPQLLVDAASVAGVGSVLLLPGVLARPVQEAAQGGDRCVVLAAESIGPATTRTRPLLNSRSRWRRPTGCARQMRSTSRVPSQSAQTDS